jgi:cytochrome c oxidase cbb3-type subunit 4
MDYHILREIADSWVLLAMFAFFVAAILWAFRPGSGATYKDASEVPFRHEDRPAAEPETGK